VQHLTCDRLNGASYRLEQLSPEEEIDPKWNITSKQVSRCRFLRIFGSRIDPISLHILLLFFFLLLGRRFSKSLRLRCFKPIGMKFGRIVLQVNTHWL